MFFDSVQAAPADPILGLNEAFQADNRSQKINLGVGVYQDENGQTPVMKCVKAAEKLLIEEETSKSYLPILGSAQYGRFAREIVFGVGSELASGERAVSCHCPGGTGALRSGADLLHQQHLAGTIWISDPTWANHCQIAAFAGLEVRRYPYFDAERHDLAFESMMNTLMQAEPGDAVLLHACCHNPTGVDLNNEQWSEVADFMARRHLLPFIDFAYQGLGHGLDEDASGVRIVAERCPEFFVASSFSKNFSLYNERVGVLTVVCADGAAAARVSSELKITVRASISNPPAHGEKVVSRVLGDPELRRQWEAELSDIRNRISSMRSLLVRRLSAAGAGDYSFLERQNGMFSFSGLRPAEVARLRQQYGIYIVGSGRICVACVNAGNVNYLADAIAQVVRERTEIKAAG